MNHRPPAALTASLLVRKGAAKPLGGMAEPDVVANEALARRHERSLPLLEIAEQVRVEADATNSGIDPEYSGEHAQTAMDLGALWDSTAPPPDGDNAVSEKYEDRVHPGVGDAGHDEDDAAAEPVGDKPTFVLLDTSDAPQYPLPVIFNPPPLPVTLPDGADPTTDFEPADLNSASRPEPSRRLWFRSIAAALLLLTAGGLAGFLMVRMIADSRGIQVSADLPPDQPTATTAIQVHATPNQTATRQPAATTVKQRQTGSTQLTAIIEAAADKVANADQAANPAPPAPLFPTPTRAVATDSGPTAGNDTIASPNSAAGVPAPRRRRGTVVGVAAQPPMPLRRPESASAQAVRTDIAGGPYRVQIGTVYTVADVEQEMVRLRSHFPDLLGDAEIFVETRAGRYRLMTGRFADASSAEATCDQFKANRQNCLVVRR